MFTEISNIKLLMTFTESLVEADIVAPGEGGELRVWHVHACVRA